jgi:hypothetical protein
VGAGSSWDVAYPTRPVKIVSPLPAGSSPDIRARIIAEQLTRMWGQQVVVENRPGGGGIIGVQAVLLIAIIEYAIANAINRRHDKVEEDDCIDAVRQHSNSILNDFGYEIRDVSGASEKVLHSLVGATQYVTKSEVLERFEKAKIIDAKDSEKLFQYMLWYGVLGIVNQNNVECYIYDFEYNMNRLQAEVDTQKDEPLYAFSPALHVALQAKGPQSSP